MKGVALSLPLVLAGLACKDDKRDVPLPTETTAAAPTARVTAPVSPSATASAVPLTANTERAMKDTVDRLPSLRGQALVTRAFPADVRRILEDPEELLLYSVDWGRDDEALGALLQGTASSRKDVLGSIVIRPEDRVAVTAWLYDGVTRPFGGSKCDQPHHALRFRKGNDVVAIVVCFECGTLALRTRAGTHRASVRWDPAFRDFLRARLLAAGVPDLSSDLRP